MLFMSPWANQNNKTQVLHSGLVINHICWHLYVYLLLQVQCIGKHLHHYKTIPIFFFFSFTSSSLLVCITIGKRENYTMTLKIFIIKIFQYCHVVFFYTYHKYFPTTTKTSPFIDSSCMQTIHLIV